MIRIEIDSKGPLSLRWPLNDPASLELGTKFIAYEDTFPPDKQSPLLSLIRTAVAGASGGTTSATSGEEVRAVSAEELRVAREAARKPLRIALAALKVVHAENLAALETYTLHSKQEEEGVVVYAPNSQKRWDSFLVKYVELQRKLDAEARIQKPALSELEPLADTVSTSLTSRDKAQVQRELGVSGRNAAAAQLHDLLEVAAGHLVVSRFNFQVTRDLKLWGYDVVEASPAPKGEEAGAAPAGP